MATPLAERPGFVGGAVRLAKRTYALDYIGFGLLQGAFALTRLIVRPTFKQFMLNDKRIQHPFAHRERVTSWENFFYCGVGPFAFILVWSVVFRVGFHKGHVSLIGLLISVAMSSFLTWTVKNAIGRPRPDLIDRCQPAKGTPYDTWIGVDVCTQPNEQMLHDGWRSFPSGHSSFAFSGLGYLAIYLAGQLHVFRPRTDLARVLITLIPFLGALLVAMSRVADYRHDPWDVSTGGSLGLAVAFFTYRRYYPSLLSRTCDTPYPSPLHDKESERHMRGRDEEDHRHLVRTQDFSLDSLSDDEETRPLTANAEEAADGQAAVQGR